MVTLGSQDQQPGRGEKDESEGRPGDEDDDSGDADERLRNLNRYQLAAALLGARGSWLLDWKSN